MSDDKKFDYEDTPEIKIADNNVGMLLKVISVVLVIICVYYFFTQRIRPTPDDAQPAKEEVQQEAK